MPKVHGIVRRIFGIEPICTLNPEEVVAMGAAIEGGVLAGDVKDIFLLDKIPHSIGIEIAGGLVCKLIEKNTGIPRIESQVFSTYTDNQSSVEIHVVAGEGSYAKQNRTLARFILDGISPAARGIPLIKVTFSIDANRILSVMANELGTGKGISVTVITSNTA